MTSPRIVDPEVQLLAAIAGTLEIDYAEEQADPWAGSPFAWIKKKRSRTIGAIGEKLVAGYLAAKDFDVVRCRDSDADRIISGARAEIKFSTLWDKGIYKFQQLRDQDYVVAICLGICPFDAHCWAIPKTVIMQNWGKVPGLGSQHGGASGEDTAWLSLDPRRPPAWLAPHGGSLQKATEALRALVPNR